jgi:hypothetical protein
MIWDFPPFCWSGYCGPWAEEIWAKQAALPFSEFGPFVPIFVQWVHLWAKDARVLYPRVTKRIFGLLSPKYLYVTVSHNDDGLEGRDGPLPELPRNLFILSQGGKGHIPLLLWLKEVNPRNYTVRDSYRYDLVFMGTEWTSWVRKPTREKMKRFGDRAFWGSSPEWEKVYMESKFVLTPRGWGRNSY